MKKVAVLSVVLVAAVSGLSWAGTASHRETQVDLAGRTAFGSVYDTRMSADAVQYIGCLVHATPGANAGVSCTARDAESERLTCGSTDAGLVQVAQSISASSFVSFACDEDMHLTSLVVNNGSVWLP